MAKQARILLVGAGQLGSRHLQALRRLQAPSEVLVVDPSEEALSQAQLRADEVRAGCAEQILHYSSSLPAAGAFDVAIVATAAAGRRELVTELISQLNVESLILEKVVFQHADDFDPVAHLLASRGGRAFVNCPRRLSATYQQLRADLLETGPISMHVVGQGWGLACNGIHFLDLFAYLTNSTAAQVDTAGLVKGSGAAKRAGYRELYGTVHACNSDGSSLTMTCLGDAYQNVTVSIANGTSETVVHESQGRIDRQNKWGNSSEDFRFKLQSELTDAVVSELLASGTCALTSYDESAEIHKPFLTAVLNHLNADQSMEFKRCPIT